MPEEFDVAIVGARIAGSIAACLLGSAGFRVLLLDAAMFPSDTISTHFFRGAGLGSVLDQLGVLDEVLALEPPRLLVDYTFRAGQADPTIDGPQTPGSLGYSLSVRRLPLDAILVDRARRTAGVEIREGTTARELLRDERGRVIGLVAERAGERFEIRTRLVIGADGRASFVARQVDAPVVRRETATRAMYYRYLRAYPSLGPAHDGAEFSFLGDELAYAFPSDAGITCLAVSINLASFARFRSNPEACFAERVLAHASVGPRFAAALPEGRILASGPMDAVIRQSSGPGWLLVGDADLHQDPWTGLGMDNASIHATFAAEAAEAWLRGRSSEVAAFATYRERRDEHALEDFEVTAASGRDLSLV